ncbi:MAG: hypothetical protein ACFFGZ_10320 [Candidatus Thorarchaeota archaeon]
MQRKAVRYGLLALLVGLHFTYAVKPTQAATETKSDEDDILVTIFRLLDVFSIEMIALPAICLIFSPSQPYLKRWAKSIVIISIAYVVIFFFLYKPLLVAVREYVVSILLYSLFSLFVKAVPPDSKSEEKASKEGDYNASAYW